MKLNTNNYKYKELIKWYRKSVNQPFKKTINDQIPEIKKHVSGNHVLYIGLSEFKKKFESDKYLSFIAIDEITSSDNITDSKRLPFEDNSHDVIVIIHALDYTANPYELIREIDRIGTDDANVTLIGFNKFSLWGLVKPLMDKMSPPWFLNFHSLYNIREWFKVLGYDSSLIKTAAFIPISSKSISRYISKIRFLQKIFASNLGGLYFLVFDKKMIPLTPIKLKFTNKYMISSFPKSSLNRVK
ncbi:MAG: methyltransferase domain-containing protein [Gammaproteobacteria bacterium]|nr:methyltransferase domain-containing protein [Gammaproteobacteria bacterium]